MCAFFFSMCFQKRTVPSADPSRAQVRSKVDLASIAAVAVLPAVTAWLFRQEATLDGTQARKSEKKCN